MDGVLLERWRRSGAVSSIFCIQCQRLISNQLYVRRDDFPDNADDPWTTFEMDLRTPATIPVVFDLTRFLVSSITFMAHLRQVSVYLDDQRLAVLDKDAGLPAEISMFSGLTPVSTEGYMTIERLKSTRR